nr:hypothetical protein CFP56_34809 [Quercus suber]
MQIAGVVFTDAILCGDNILGMLFGESASDWELRVAPKAVVGLPFQHEVSPDVDRNLVKSGISQHDQHSARSMVIYVPSHPPMILEGGSDGHRASVGICGPQDQDRVGPQRLASAHVERNGCGGTTEAGSRQDCAREPTAPACTICWMPRVHEMWCVVLELKCEHFKLSRQSTTHVRTASDRMHHCTTSFSSCCVCSSHGAGHLRSLDHRDAVTIVPGIGRGWPATAAAAAPREISPNGCADADRSRIQSSLRTAADAKHCKLPQTLPTVDLILPCRASFVSIISNERYFRSRSDAANLVQDIVVAVCWYLRPARISGAGVLDAAAAGNPGPNVSLLTHQCQVLPIGIGLVQYQGG